MFPSPLTFLQWPIVKTKQSLTNFAFMLLVPGVDRAVATFAPV